MRRPFAFCDLIPADTLLSKESDSRYHDRMRRPFAFCDLIPGDTLLSKESDFVLLSREREQFTWLDLREKQFTCRLNPTAPVPTSYTIMRAGSVIRKPAL